MIALNLWRFSTAVARYTIAQDDRRGMFTDNVSPNPRRNSKHIRDVKKQEETRNQRHADGLAWLLTSSEPRTRRRRKRVSLRAPKLVDQLQLSHRHQVSFYTRLYEHGAIFDAGSKRTYRRRHDVYTNDTIQCLRTYRTVLRHS